MHHITHGCSKSDLAASSGENADDTTWTENLDCWGSNCVFYLCNSKYLQVLRFATLEKVALRKLQLVCQSYDRQLFKNTHVVFPTPVSVPGKGFTLN